MSETKSGGLMAAFKEPRVQAIAAAAYPLIALGVGWATVTTTLNSHAQDIRDLKQSGVSLYTLAANVSAIKEGLSDLKLLTKDNYEELHALVTDIQRQIYAQRSSPTAMPASVTSSYEQGKAGN